MGERGRKAIVRGMTGMVRLRAVDADSVEVDRWAERFGMERSVLLRDALAGHLARLRAEEDVAAYAAQPETPDEVALDTADDWGPAEDWTDWVTWADRRNSATG